MNIFALWLVLFLFYAIAYVEVFGLTRWGSAGAWNSNYSEFLKALVLLALQSTGFVFNYRHARLCTADSLACLQRGLERGQQTAVRNWPQRRACADATARSSCTTTRSSFPTALNRTITSSPIAEAPDGL